jgi:SAM-dependent methyltransferase
VGGSRDLGEGRRPLFRSLLSILACPDCSDSLETEPGGGEEGPVLEGALRCPRCSRRFPIVRGIPRLSRDSAAPAVPEFDRQWRHYGRLRRLFGKDARAMRENLGNERMGSRIRAEWYRGKAVLDAGCGHGRYVAAFSALGAGAVGLDASAAIDLTGLPRDDPSIQLVQGDVLSLPFRDESFDLAFCDGVLHHTPDPARGFRELARVVRPGGAVYAWLYPREGRLREAVFRAVRAATTRLPGAGLRALAFALAPATLVVRSYSGTRLGRATWAECAQVVHDWLAPRLQSHHTFEEVAGWAAASGLAGAERLPVAVGIVAWKPARGAPRARVTNRS